MSGYVFIGIISLMTGKMVPVQASATERTKIVSVIFL